MDSYLPTDLDRDYFMEMRRRLHDANPGLPLVEAPGMRKTKKSRSRSSPKPKPKSKSRSRSSPKPKARSKSRSKSKSRSRSKSKSPPKPTKKQLMSKMYKQAQRDIPSLRNPKKRQEYINKIKTIPMKDLRVMVEPIEVFNYVPKVTQAQGLRASDLGQTLVRTNRRRVNEMQRM